MNYQSNNLWSLLDGPSEDVQELLSNLSSEELKDIHVRVLLKLYGHL